jgi:hypothetical protein
VIAFGFMVGAAVTAPVFFVLGVFSGIDRTRSHERADIKPALRRSVR